MGQRCLASEALQGPPLKAMQQPCSTQFKCCRGLHFAVGDAAAAAHFAALGVLPPPPAPGRGGPRCGDAAAAAWPLRRRLMPELASTAGAAAAGWSAPAAGAGGV